MLHQTQLRVILALLKSEDEAKILLAIHLINSLDTFDYPPQDNELLNNDSLQGFEHPNALYVYQGIKNEAAIVSIIDTWKPFIEKRWQEDNTIPRRKLSAIIIQLLSFEEGYQVNEGNHPIKLVVQQHSKYYHIWLREVWQPKKLCKLIFYLHQSNVTIDDFWAMQKPRRRYRQKNPVHPFLQGTKDIVRRTGNWTKYAIHSCPNSPLVNLTIQATIDAE